MIEVDVVWETGWGWDGVGVGWGCVGFVRVRFLPFAIPSKEIDARGVDDLFPVRAVRCVGPLGFLCSIGSARFLWCGLETIDFFPPFLRERNGCYLKAKASTLCGALQVASVDVTAPTTIDCESGDGRWILFCWSCKQPQGLLTGSSGF